MRARVTWVDDDGEHRERVITIPEDGSEIPLPAGANPRLRRVVMYEDDETDYRPAAVVT